MAKTGDSENLGTAEGAVMGRAAHAIHAQPPILDDFWAVELLDEATQAVVRDPEHYRTQHDPKNAPMALVLAIGVGCLRFAEDEVEACAKRGFTQYVILGAGFDTFALRRADLSDVLRVYEVDHPDVQRLKRARVEAAKRRPAARAEYVPVDFEVTSLGPALRASPFDRSSPTVISWLNTLPYLSEEATATTLREIADTVAPGSRVIANYAPVSEFSTEQLELSEFLAKTVVERNEPFRSRWEPERFLALLDECGFDVVTHWDENDLTERYFKDRPDGLKPGLPLRLVCAELRG